MCHRSVGSIGKVWVRAKKSKDIIIPSVFIILYSACSNYKAQPTNSDVLRNIIFVISLIKVDVILALSPHPIRVVKKLHLIIGGPCPQNCMRISELKWSQKTG